MKLPDYLILGETKCGTTSLYNYLIQSPDICDTFGNHVTYNQDYNTKEIRFFDRYYDKGVDWYKGCFPDTSIGKIVGEATPMYLYRTISINRIKKVCPEAMFIILLRDPVARLYSNFNHNFKWVPGFKEKYSSFEIFWNSVHDSDYYLIEKGLYYYTLIKWFNQFDRRQFHIVRSEDLFYKTQETYSGILKFLKVSDHKLENVKIYRKNDYNKLNPSLRKEIEKFYLPYNNMLEELLGNGFNWEYKL